MKNSMILLPIAAYILLTLNFTQKVSVRGVAEAFVKGHIILFAFIAISTEILSLFHGITYPLLLTTWIFFLFVCFSALFRNVNWRNFSLPLLQRMSPVTIIYVGTIVTILLATLTTAILYPPNTWDSMTYHMPRVIHWINNNDVSFYPTEISRQNFSAPLAEFAIMHVLILTGSDLYANLVQWISFLVIVCLGLLVAVELGLSNRQQWISAIIIATIPMAILQASSTQNDLVVTAFLMSFSLFMYRLRDNFNFQNLLFAAISLGLALLTKGTAYIYGAAIGISLAAPVLIDRRYDFPGFIKATAALLLVVFIAFILNAGYFWRNYNLYEHPLSTETESTRNQEFSATVLTSNLLRNGALHLATPSNLINQYEYDTLKAILGSQLNNPKTTFLSTSFSIPYFRHEDHAGNLIHMLIALASVVLLPIAWSKGHYRRTIWYSVGIFMGIILYSFTLKWQPWASRLHTPVFALSAPLLAITITSAVGSTRKNIEHVILLLMVLYSFSFAFSNPTRSLVPPKWKHIDRNQLYFINRRELFPDYASAFNFLVNAGYYGEVGLYLGGNDWEYPFWVFARQTEKNGRTMTFRHVGISDISRSIQEEALLPPYVIATKPINKWEHASEYKFVYSYHHVSVFRKSRNNM